MPDIEPQQKVLVDGEVIATYVRDVPGEPDKAILESWGVGSFVVDKSRLQPLA